MKSTTWPYFINKSFNLPYLEQSRYKWIDYIRGIAILLVVYRHVLIGIERTGLYVPQYLVTANMIFYSFRMPLFFIISGLFVQSSLAKRTFGKFIRNKFELILFPYFIWCFLQITLQIFFSTYTNANRSFIDYTYILYHPRQLDQFWYLPALFNVTVIYSLIKIKLKPAIFLQLLMGLVFYFLSRSFNQVSMISDWMEFYFFFAVGDAFSSFFFRQNVQQFFSRWDVFFAFIPVFSALQLYYLYRGEEYFLSDWMGRGEFIVISIAGCLFMFIVAFAIQKTNSFSFLRVIGIHSLYIYVMHVFVAAFVRIVLMKLFLITNTVFLLVAGIVVSIVVCIVVYNLLIRNGPLWFLFSMQRKPNAALQVKETSPT